MPPNTPIPAKLPADDLKRRIARNLRRLRRERELTGLELARASGIAPSYIVKIERHGANLTIDVLERLADALGVPVTELQRGPHTGLGTLASSPGPASRPTMATADATGQGAAPSQPATPTGA